MRQGNRDGAICCVYYWLLRSLDSIPASGRPLQGTGLGNGVRWGGGAEGLVLLLAVGVLAPWVVLALRAFPYEELVLPSWVDFTLARERWRALALPRTPLRGVGDAITRSRLSCCAISLLLSLVDAMVYGA